MKRFFCLFLAFSVYGCSKHSDSGDERLFSLGRHKLAIPAKYMPFETTGSNFDSAGIMDNTGGISVIVPVDELGVLPSSENGLKKSIVVLLQLPPEKDASFLPSDAVAAWAGTGIYGRSITEVDPGNGFYKVYPESGYPLVWQYFRARPGPGGNPEVEWVAGCIKAPKVNDEAVRQTICKTAKVYDGLYSEISFEGSYIGILDHMLQGYTALLSGWVAKGSVRRGQ